MKSAATRAGRRLGTLALLGLALFVGMGGTEPASAQAPQCSALVNETDSTRLLEAHDALEVDADERLLVVGSAPPGAPSLRIEVGFPVARFTVVDEQLGSTADGAPGTRWVWAPDVSDYAVFGVGLYQVTATSGGCTVTAWIRVVGRSPFTTVAGVSASLMLLAGLALDISGLIAASRRGRGLARAVGGGLLLGIGALVLAQQFGRGAFTWTAVATWLGIPGGLSGVGHLALTAVGRRRLPVPSGEPEAGAEAPPAEAPQPVEAGMPPVEAEAPPVELERLGAAAGDGPGQDPPRSAYARLDCPDVVVAGREFELIVGLAPEPTAGVVGGPLVRPASSVGPYTISIQVVAEGFRPTRGAAWRQDLPVTAEAPHPAVVLHLAADYPPSGVRAGTIQAMFSVEGQTMGLAVRSVAVVATEDLLAGAPVSPQEAGADITVPTARIAPDLTIRILFGESESDGRLLWTFESPHDGIGLPDAPVGTDIGAHPEAFAKQLVQRVGAREGRPGLYQYLTGIGYTVADQVPAAFWDLLRAVAQRTGGGAPTLLILSQEPHVPWELAIVEPPIDPAAPPFLAAQCTVGRWVLGRSRPKLPPPLEVRVDAMAVLWGVYDRQEWRLLEAEDEAARIREAYAAQSVNADTQSVLDCLKGSPRADVLHFAVHGVYDPAGPQEGLVLLDGQTLDPMQVRGTRLEGSPFVFINACQVGSGNEVLGDYAGMAEAFLYAGASGVVAPLWSIGDAVAKEIALRFYQETLRKGATPAEVFRTERAAFRDADEPVSSTYLAYQFFGHPAMKLRT